MRSAGCIVNDIVDRNFDRKVQRTRNRPVAARKISILLASHNMNEVTRLCKTVLMMKDGVIIDSGYPEDLIKKHGRKNLEEVFLKLSRSADELY